MQYTTFKPEDKPQIIEAIAKLRAEKERRNLPVQPSLPLPIEEILESLCYYDKRNPDCVGDDDDIESHKEAMLREAKKFNRTPSCF